MPRLLEIREICERALRKIGSYSINDQGAIAEEMDEARHWLDLIVGHITSRKRTWFLVPASATIALMPGQTAYPLSGLGTADSPVQFAIAAFLREIDSGRAHELPLARRLEWEAREPHNPGPPVLAYVDRSREPTLLLHPPPPDNVLHEVVLTYQRFSADWTRGANTAPAPDLRESWNLYLITALAYELGNGPVRKLPADEVREMGERARELLKELDDYEMHEQANEPRRTSFHDF